MQPLERSSARHVAKLAVLTLSILSAFGGLFQNCSKVAVTDLTEEERIAAAHVAYVGAGEATVDVGSSQFDKASAIYNVGLDSVPPLKQVWIVDNSGTMVNNNINLANSFGAMFNQNNKDSLYKFNTTAFLLSTAQTIPSLRSADRQVLIDAYSLQQNYWLNPPQSANDFSLNFRTATLNSGKLPGDNLGTAIRLTGSSTTDYSIRPQAVFGMSNSNSFSLTNSFNKPANTDTTVFEQEFTDRLAVLQYQRIPKITTLVNGTIYEDAQSAKIVDTESGLCGLARILDNPDSYFNANDMLAVTIVSDENENDVAGTKCLKRSAYIKSSDNYISGRCSEFRTTMQIQTRNRDAKSCTLNGYASYKAEFAYSFPYANISYYYQKTPASTSSSTPQTKVSWQTPTTVNVYSQLQTKISYYTWKTNPAVYSYQMKQIPVKYYTKVCTQTNSDGIVTLKCVPSSVATVKYIAGNAFSTCNAAAAGFDANAIVSTSAYITSDYLPDCNGTVTYANVSSCNTSDTANCKQTLVSPAANVVDKGPFVDEVFVGDHVADCDSALGAKYSNAILSTNSNFAASYKPVCKTASWVTLSGSSCSASATCNISAVAGTPANGSLTVLGTIANGSSACISNANIPANAIAGTVNCSPAAALITNTACSSDQLAAGCTSTVTAATYAYSSSQRVDNISSLSACTTWVSSQTNNRTDGSHPIVCDLQTEARIAYVQKTFSQVGDFSLNAGDLCGASANVFYSGLSTAEKSLIPSTSASSLCKINSLVAGSGVIRPLASGQTCLAQRDTDCSAIGYRSCSTADSGGGFTSGYSAWANFSSLKKKDVSCSTKCSDLLPGDCESWSDQAITYAQYLANKYGNDVQVNCQASPSTEVLPAVSTVTSRPVADSANFCQASGAGVPRYFVATTSAAPLDSYVDEFVAGNSDDGLSPKMDLIEFIKRKIDERSLNINVSVFIRRSNDPDGIGTGINYKGVDYERLISSLTTPSVSSGVPSATGQVYSVLASSYADALTNLSSVIKSKLIRSFTVPGIQDYQVITGVRITSLSGAVLDLAIGQWTQSGKVVTIANSVPINEGDRISITYQNDDGYVYSLLKKIFIISQMRPDQIVKSVDQIKADGQVIHLTADQWAKEGNKVTIIDSKVSIQGGDKFHIMFKNNVAED